MAMGIGLGMVDETLQAPGGLDGWIGWHGIMGWGYYT